jgi:hypothetical protein
MALVFALFAIVVLGALIGGAFFVGRVEQVTGYNTVWASQANEAADAGLTHATNTVDAGSYQAMGVYSPSTPNELALATVSSDGIAFTDTIRRLNNTLFEVRSTGRKVGSGGVVLAQASVAQLVRLAKATIDINAAVTVQDPINFNGNSFLIDGFNDYPVGWGGGDCPSGAPDAGNTDDKVAIRSSTSTGAKAADMDNLAGYPAQTAPNDPSITSTTFQDFLDYTYFTLASQPNVKKLPLTTPYNGIVPVLDAGGSCDKSAPFNFGEPWRTAGNVAACTGFFPVVHGTGSETKFGAGNRGQGILLIDGDMELVGGFEWTGIVLVRGKMKIAGNGNKITGAVLTEGVDLITAGTINGNIEVQFSQCAIDRAVNGAAVPQPLSRGWAQMF